MNTEQERINKLVIRKKQGGRLGMKYNLADICEYAKGKVDVAILDEDTYISTENMMPNKGGITSASSLPTVAQTQVFLAGDILVSNIRPYFKKIWFAEFDGGCSNDVLVFRAKDGVSKRFLYYVLANDTFFDYSMATSKGTKMPRGDKAAIMKYDIPEFTYEEQEKIAGILDALDRKIQLNTEINRNLEEQLKSLFIKMFAAGIDSSTDSGISLNELVVSVDNRGKTPPLENVPTDYPIIDVRALSGTSRIIDYNNCSKYVSQHTYETWFRSGHPQPYDILISTVGSLAETKIFLGNVGCIAQNVVGLRSKSLSPLYLYQYLNYIKHDLVAYNIGSVQPSIKVTHILKHLIYIPSTEDINVFDSIARSITDQIFLNCQENNRLAVLRDSLLPKLMSGELDVSGIDL